MSRRIFVPIIISVVISSGVRADTSANGVPAQADASKPGAKFLLDAKTNSAKALEKKQAGCTPLAVDGARNQEFNLKNIGICPLSFVFPHTFDVSVFGDNVPGTLQSATVYVSPDRTVENGVVLFTTDDPQTGACLTDQTNDYCFAAVPLEQNSVPDSHFVIAQAKVKGGPGHATVTTAVQVREGRLTLLQVSAGAAFGVYEQHGQLVFNPSAFLFGGVAWAYDGYCKNKFLPRAAGVLYNPTVFTSYSLAGLGVVGLGATFFDHRILVGAVRDFGVDRTRFVVGWNVTIGSLGSLDGPF